MTTLALTSVPVSRAGVTITSGSLTSLGSNTTVSWRNEPYTGLIIYNGSGSSITATPQISKTVEGQAVSLTGLAVTVAASAYVIMGGFSLADFTSTDGTGNIYVVFSSSTTVSVGLIDIPYVS